MDHCPRAEGKFEQADPASPWQAQNRLLARGLGLKALGAG